jgi:hypothetical protein
MTNTELNRKICKKLGIERHEVVWKDCKTFNVKYCSCGYKYGFKDEEHSNPDFAANAKDLIEVLMKREDWREFKREIGLSPHSPKCLFIDFNYILNPRLLCERFLEWEGK